MCASCHARRQQFSSDPAATGKLHEMFRPSLLERGLYHVDGQQRDEVFNYGSFVQSKMHAAGVTCSDCHNPHSGKLRETGNAVCEQCHAPEKFDTAAHHHHREGTAGAQCAACHMPTTTYMGVDARHDHSMRIARPDQSIMLGTPNACTACHSNKPASWAEDAVKIWYPSKKSGMQNFAEAFDLGDRSAPGAQTALTKIADAGAGSAISRASALARLRNFQSPDVLGLAARSLRIEDPLVRAAAVPILADADAQNRISLLRPLLRDPSRVVRMDAARALAEMDATALPVEDRAAYDTALGEYVAGQLFNAERPEAHVNLGGLYRAQGKLDDARASFRTAMELDTTFVAASISLAELERANGNEPGAEEVLRKALADNPKSGSVAHALGLSLIRQKRTAEAMDFLEQATDFEPDSAHFSYVFAVALYERGKKSEATAVLKNRLASFPYDRELLTTLITYEMQAGNYSEALKHGELLDQLEPNNPQIADMLVQLRQRAQ